MRPATLTRLQRLTYRVWLAVGVVLLVAVSLYLAYRPLAVVFAPVLFALLIVYLLNPLVTLFERWRLHRLVGTTLAYVLVIAVAVGLGVLIVPLLGGQVREFASEAPNLGAELSDWVRSAAAQVGIDLDVTAFADAQELAERVQTFVTEAENFDAVLALLGGLSGLARGAFFVLLTLGVGPVIAFYLLADLPRFKRVLLGLVPPHHRDEVVEVGGKLTTVVGGFVRGQLVIAFFVGLLASLVLGVLGLRFWLVVGVIAGVTNLVPLLGPFVAGVIGVTIGVLTEGVGFAVLVAVALTGVQQVDSNLLSPLIMGRTVRVHPLAVLLGILVGGTLYGVFGMLVVVPLIAGAKVLAQHFWQTRVPWAVDPDEVVDEHAPAPTSPEGDAQASEAPASTGDVAHGDDAPARAHG